MAIAVERIVGPFLQGGLVVTTDKPARCPKSMMVREAGHPLPDYRGQKAAHEILQLVDSLTAQDLILFVLSGGASSLLSAPSPGLTLQNKRETTRALLRCGATIREINIVRKHMSAIKGGRLAAATPATIYALILSDVPGDDLSTIGSGPTAPDPTTYEEAFAILRRYRIWTALPRAVRRHFQRGLAGTIPETPKPNTPIFRRVHNCIIGNNVQAASAISRQARRLGYRSLILTSQLTGEAKEVGKVLGSIGKDIDRIGRPISRPACIILGGEPTVTVHGSGKGGRAQEVVLGAALAIASQRKLWVAGLGTDGRDGPTDVAGAVANDRFVAQCRAKGLDPHRLLAMHASYACFQAVGGHIRTGPTGTNVNDVYLILAP